MERKNTAGREGGERGRKKGEAKMKVFFIKSSCKVETLDKRAGWSNGHSRLSDFPANLKSWGPVQQSV